MSEQNGFTTKEILVEFRDEMRTEFKKMQATFTTAHSDHETRLRKVEGAASRLKGALALVAIVAPLAAGVVAAVVH